MRLPASIITTPEKVGSQRAPSFSQAGAAASTMRERDGGTNSAWRVRIGSNMLSRSRRESWPAV